MIFYLKINIIFFYLRENIREEIIKLEHYLESIQVNCYF